MQIWFKMDLTQSHLRTSFQIFFYRLSFSFNRADAHSGHYNNFFYSICYQLVNKTRNLLFAMQLLIYIIYGGRTIIGFVGFIANLLNRPTDAATVSVRKRVTFRALVGM
jgi:hypothetical protein